MTNNIKENLIATLGSFYRNNYGETLIFKWKDGVEFEAIIDTLSETDNGKELNDEEFEEYHACYITIVKVMELQQSLNTINARFGANIEVNRGYEISCINAPDYIYKKDGSILWKK